MDLPIGQRIKTWRERNDKTLAECAAAMGIHASGLSRIEHGTQRVTADQLEALVALLGLTMVEFYGDIPEAPTTDAIPTDDKTAAAN